VKLASLAVVGRADYQQGFGTQGGQIQDRTETSNNQSTYAKATADKPRTHNIQ
jgi:hypothetical protein